MPARKRTVELEVIADTRKATTDLKRLGDNAQTTGGRFQKAGDLVKVAMGGVAAGAVGRFARDAIQSFSELEQSVGGTEAVFGNAKGVIDDFAEGSADAIGLSEAAFRTATTQIGGQLKRMTGDVDFAAEHSIQLTQVAADLAATYGGTTAEAVAALGSAFRGEADPAERFNLNLKVSKVNAKAVEMGLAATTGSVDDNARAQATLALITEQSADALGQFAREADTAAGQAQRLTSKFEDFKAQLGAELVPVANQAMEAGTNLLDAFSEDINLGWSQRLSAAMQTLLGESADSVQAYIEQKESINNLGTEIDDVVEKTEESIGAANRHRGSQEDLRDAIDEVTGATGVAIPNAEALAFEMEREADAAKASRDALMDKRDALREIHNPYFRVFNLSKDLTAAEEDLAEAIRDHGEASDEAVVAAMRVGEINADLEGIFLDLKKQGIDPTSAAVRTMFEGLGLPQATINRIIAQFDAMEQNYENRRFATHITVPDLHARSDGTFVKTGTRNFFHEGGVVPGVPGESVPIMAQAGEEVTRRSEVGHRGGQTVINYYPGTTIGNERVLRELLEMARRQ